MNKIAEVMEGLGLVEKRPVLKIVDPGLKEFTRSPEAPAIANEMATMILNAEINVESAPQAA